MSNFQGAMILDGNCQCGNCPGGNCWGGGGQYTRRSCPRTQIYTNGLFKSKTARRNRYRYIGFGFSNSVLSIFSLISGGR